DRAAAVEVRATERRVAERTEVRQPHRQVVDSDATHAVEIEGAHRGAADERAILVDLPTAEQGHRIPRTVAAAEQGEAHAAIRCGEGAHGLCGTVHDQAG